MVLTRTDELALEQARQCIRNCGRYNIPPAPYFPLLLRMHEELESLGRITNTDERAGDFCAGCPEDRSGSCGNGYQMAELSLDGRQVLRCRYRAIAERKAGR